MPVNEFNITVDGGGASATDAVVSGSLGPSADAVDTSSSQTLTNKTLSAPNITTGLTLTGAAGTSGQVLTSQGSGAAPAWTTIGATLTRSARTSNTILGTADKGTLIDITSGTFTQTFTAAATLGAGWFVYIRNSGTGDITLDPNASELIDGLASYVMYPNETRLVQCDGSGFTSVVLSPFYRVFTTTETFTTPPGYRYFQGLLWGAGGSGALGTGGSGPQGGGGAACFPFVFSATDLGASQTVTIAATATAPATAANGTQGGNSSIGALLTAYGGAGGTQASSGGGGGGLYAAGASSVGGGPSAGSVSLFGGGTGAATSYGAAGSSIYGGGGGGGYGGSSVYGGGGGGGSSALTAGTSIFGGSGGAGAATGVTNGQPGVAPGGGGGGSSFTVAGNGARGECRIWGVA